MTGMVAIAIYHKGQYITKGIIHVEHQAGFQQASATYYFCQISFLKIRGLFGDLNKNKGLLFYLQQARRESTGLNVVRKSGAKA